MRKPFLSVLGVICIHITTFLIMMRNSHALLERSKKPVSDCGWFHMVSRSNRAIVRTWLIFYQFDIDSSVHTLLDSTILYRTGLFDFFDAKDPPKLG